MFDIIKNTIQKRYKLIASFTLLVVIFIVVCVIFLQKRNIYKISIEIGKKPDWNFKGAIHLIEPPKLTIIRIRDSIIPSLTQNINKKYSLLSYNVYNPKKENIILIEVKAPNSLNNQAIELLESVANKVTTEHLSLITPLQNELQRQVRFLENQIKLYDMEISNLQSQENNFVEARANILTSTTGMEKTINMIFLDNHLNRLTWRIESVENLKEQSTQSLARARMQLSCFTPTRALSMPVRSPAFPGPSLSVLIMLGTIAGATGGFMLALLAEYMTQFKDDGRSKNPSHGKNSSA
ncbi:hypothetical protein ACLG6S_01160 [Thermodesulfobacteriota bacterium B35]